MNLNHHWLELGMELNLQFVSTIQIVGILNVNILG
jgi:hypothetical protein